MPYQRDMLIFLEGRFAGDLAYSFLFCVWPIEIEVMLFLFVLALWRSGRQPSTSGFFEPFQVSKPLKSR